MEDSLEFEFIHFMLRYFFFLSGFSLHLFKFNAKKLQRGVLLKQFQTIIATCFIFGGSSYLWGLLVERRFREDTEVPIIKPLFGLFFGSGSVLMLYFGFLPCLFVVKLLFW